METEKATSRGITLLWKLRRLYLRAWSWWSLPAFYLRAVLLWLES